MNKTLICELSGDIKKIWKYLKFTEVTVRENENLIFHGHFFNMDISANIP